MPFSDLAWLNEVHRSSMPKRRLFEIFLLITRMALLLFLVMFFARPIFNRGYFASSSDEQESMVVLLDNSASMSISESGKEGLDWAKSRLQEVLRKIPLEVKIGLVVFSDQVEQELAPTDERSRLTSLIDETKVSYRKTDVEPALKMAAGMLAHQPKGRKTLIIASDAARHAWHSILQKGSSELGLEPDVRLLLWECIDKVSNSGFSEASVEMSEEGFLNGQAQIHSLTGNPKESLWSFELNKQIVAQGLWKEGGLQFKAHSPKGGFYAGQLSKSPDSASYDDVYYLAGRLPKGFRVLLVDGEAGLSPADSETYYLRSALESPRDPRLESVDVIRPESLARENFENYHVIVLANVPEPLEGFPRENELRAWIEKGGGLFLTAGAKWPKSPRVPLQLFRSTALINRPERGVRIDSQDSLFSKTPRLVDFEWDQIEVTSHVQFEADSTAAVSLSLKNGDPLLIRKTIGQGTVYCLTTSLDRSWTNFPAKPVFSPFVRELMATLADPTKTQAALQAWVGEPLRLPVPKGVKSVSVISPTGVVSGANLKSDGFLEASAPPGPGLYQVKTDQRSTDFSFAVNIPHLRQEGDLSRLSEKELKDLFPGHQVEMVSSGNKKADALVAALLGRELATPLLIFLFLLFVVETILGWRRKSS
ncbi:MAG: hypothetical protein KCHDKBKB_00370 [Elusimicrobia bacterium]|nr:hypothetical protein [Elusimicrobiota bacterium]